MVARNVGDVSAEEATWGSLLKLPIEQIGKRAVLCGLFHDSLVRVLPSNHTHQFVLFHDAFDLLVVEDNVLFSPKLHADRPPAPLPLASVEYFLNEQVVAVIFLVPGCLFEPLVVTAPRNTGNLAQQTDIFLQRFDDSIFLARP